MTFYPVPKPEKKEKMKNTPRTSVPGNPLEEEEQQTVADWLTLHKVFFTATIGGSYLHPATYNRVKKLGLKRGCPDILIFKKPPTYNGKYTGVAIEMKRRKSGALSPEQQEFQFKLRENGWMTITARGADEAIETLETCGYGGNK